MRQNFYPKKVISSLLLLFATIFVNLPSSTAQSATALNFDGYDDFVAVNNPFRSFGKELTVEFWMYTPDAKMPYGSIMGQGTSNIDNWSGHNVWLMHPENDDAGTLSFYINDAGTPKAVTCKILAGGWHHYAGVANATSTKIYVDGVLISTGPGVSNTILNNASSVIHIGKDVRFDVGKPGDRRRYGNMSIDEVRIWSRALCQDEINARKNCQITSTAGLQEYYQFNQGTVGANNSTQNFVSDMSGNSRNGVLNNFALNGAASNWVASGATNTGNCPAYVAPILPISGSTSICAGSTTTLSSTSAGGKWTSSNPAVASVNINTGVVTAVSVGTTTITYSTECASGSVSFTVKALPNSTITAGDATNICPGSFVTLGTVAASGNTYQWFNNGNSINGATNVTYNAANSGAYTVRVTNNGCSSISSSPISVNAVDAIAPSLTSPATIVTPTNPQGNIYATSANGAVVHYSLPTFVDNCNGQVSVVGLPASGSVFPIGTTAVTVIATDASGNSTPYEFAITVVGVEPSIVVPTNIISCNPIVNFAASETVGIPASTISYSIAPGSTFPVGTTTVTATATNAFGTSTKSFTVTVSKPIAEITASGSTTICAGTSVTLTANNGVSYLWSNGATTQSITVSTPGSYTVNVTNSNGCTATSAATTVANIVGVDSDGDGVPDACDADDDNDGILDIVECNKSNFYWSNPPTVNGNTATGVINGVNYTYTSSRPVETTTSVFAHNVFPSSFGIPNIQCIKNVYRSNNTLTFASPVTNPILVFSSIGQPNLYVPIEFSAPIEILWSTAVVKNSSTKITGNEGYAVIRLNGTFSSISFNYLADENWVNFLFGADFQTCGDTDGDGIPDKLDTDSDNDGCPDAIEGSQNPTLAQTLNGRLTGGIDASGIPTLVNGGQGIGTSQNANLNCFCQAGIDKKAPVITCVSNIEVNATSASGAVVTYTTPTATDDCAVTITRTAGLASGSVFPIGSTIITHTATDAAGNISSCSFNITVLSLPPQIIVPSTITVNAPVNACGAVVNFAATETTAIPASAITYSHQPGSTFPVGITTVTATATNVAGISSATFDVVVKDVTAPTIAATSNLNAIATSAAGAVVTYTLPTATDNCAGIVNVTASPASGSIFPMGTTTVTVTATDAAGNIASSTFDVTVAGVLPSIVSPGNITVNAGSGLCGAVVNFTATETTGIPASTITYTIQPGTQFAVGNTQVTATATNEVGSSSVTFTVTVVDNQFPVISNPPTDIVVSCESIPSLVNLTATDNCSIANSLMYQSFSSSMKVDLVHGYNFENNLTDTKGSANGANVNGVSFAPGISGSALNFNGNGAYVNLGTAGSLSGTNNFGVSVWVKTSSSSPMTVIQQRDGNVNGQYIINIGSDHNGGRVYPGKVYFMVYNNAFQFELVSSVRVDDGKWHHIVAERDGTSGRIYVDGNLVASGSGPFVSLTSSIVTYIGKDVRDNNKPFNGQIDQLKIYAGGLTPKTYDLERTWSFKDASGNTSIAQQVVTVQDLTPPVIGNATITSPTDANGAVIATSAAGAVVNYTMPTALDNCAGTTQVSTSKASGTVFPIGTTTVTFTSTDNVGNTAIKTWTVTVKGIPPSIVVPSTITVNAPANACGAVVNFAATETTAIPASAITYSHQPGSTFPVGTTTVTATATNAVGTSFATFDVVVKDVTAPTIAATSNINAIATSAAGAVVTYTLPTATDNCSGGVTVVASPASGSTFPIGTTTVTVTATDAANNSSSSSFTVTVVGIPPSIVVPSTIRVDASSTNCGAVVNFAATETTAIPASTITYSHQPGSVFSLGTTVVTATATNSVGADSKTFEIIVTDNTAPVINTPAAPIFCENAAGSYTLPTVNASDNCGVASVSFAITGATQRTGTGFDAGSAFNVGTSTITYTVTDVNGNVSTKAWVVTVNKAPTATISTSNPDAFCNKWTVIGNSSSSITGYAWTYNSNAFASTQAISLDNTNGDGTYSLFVTDNKGCTSLTAVTYQYSKQNTISNYTILAYKEAELKEYNTVQTGSVGVMSNKGKAEIGKNSSVAAPGAFVKAPRLEVKQGANVPIRLVGVATVGLPTMQYNTANTNNLPNYTTNNGATISLSGNYKNLKIRKGSNVTLSGTTFGNIDIEEGSVVRFTSTVINVEHLKVGKGPGNGLTQVRFADNTSVRVAKHVQIEEDCFINPDGYKVTFYLGRQSNHDCNNHKNKYSNGHDKDDDNDDDHDRGHGDGDQKFEVKGGNTTVIANVYAPTGDIKVKGGEGCHKNHSSTVVRMTGLFIGYEVEGDGRNIIWNNYTCGSASPIAAADAQPVYNKTAEPTDVADELKVTVMPNPSTSYFTLKLASKSELPVNVKVVDAVGRVIDTRAKQPANSTFQMGHNYTTGSYFAEFIQGNQRKVVQLIKLK